MTDTEFQQFIVMDVTPPIVFPEFFWKTHESGYWGMKVVTGYSPM